MEEREKDIIEDSNLKRKSVKDIIEETKTNICNNYCRFNAGTVCSHCPLNYL